MGKEKPRTYKTGPRYTCLSLVTRPCFLCALSGGDIARPGLRSFHDFELERPELGDILSRNLVQNRITLMSQMNFDEAAIFLPGSFAYQPASFGALDQPYNSVVASLQELSEFRDGGPAAARVARHSQQELVLLRSDSRRPRHLLAEPEKAPDPVTKPCQPPQRVYTHRGYANIMGSGFHQQQLYHNVI